MTNRPPDGQIGGAPAGWPLMERAIFAGVLGLPGYAAIGIALGFTGLGVFIDLERINGLGTVFKACYFLGCVLAVGWVKRRALFGPMVQPPLLLALAVPGVVLVSGDVGTRGGTAARLLAIGTPLLNGFPTMAVTTAFVLIIGLIRYRTQRPSNEPEPIRAARPVPLRDEDDPDRAERRARAERDRALSGPDPDDPPDRPSLAERLGRKEREQEERGDAAREHRPETGTGSTRAEPEGATGAEPVRSPADASRAPATRGPAAPPETDAERTEQQERPPVDAPYRPRQADRRRPADQRAGAPATSGASVVSGASGGPGASDDEPTSLLPLGDDAPAEPVGVQPGRAPSGPPPGRNTPPGPPPGRGRPPTGTQQTPREPRRP